MTVEKNGTDMKRSKKSQALEAEAKQTSHNGTSVYSTSWAKLGDIMHKSVIVTEPDISVVQAAQMMADRSSSCMVVAQGEDIIGIVTETDLIRKVVKQCKENNDLSVRDIMTSPVVTMCESVKIVEAGEVMEENKVKRMPVTKDGKIVGIVTQTDLIQAMTSHIYCDISQIMSDTVETSDGDETINKIAQKMTTNKISCIVVMDKEKVQGVITERDIIKKVLATERYPATTKAKEIMSSSIISVPSTYSAFSTGKVMERKGVRRLLVIDDGKLRGIVTQTDIFKAAKNMLGEQKRNIILQAESSQTALCDIRPDFVVAYANPAFVKLLGIENQKEILGKQFLPNEFWINPKDSESFINDLKTGEFELRELQLKSASGKTLYLTVFANFNKDTHGQTERIRIVIYDITAKKQLAEQKRLEQDLKESEERFHNLMDNTPGVSVQGYSLDGTVFYWNKASELIFGYKSEEVIGKKEIDLVVPDELKEQFQKHLEVAARKNESGQFVPAGEMNLVNQKGEPVPVHSIHTMVSIEGKEPMIFRIDVDLTERKVIEKQLKSAISKAEKAQSELEFANKKLEQSARKANCRAQEAMVSDLTKSQFLASMSHEIRTPLNAIIGLSEVLTEETLDDEQKTYLDMIRESAQNMLVLINDILDFSKIQAGRFDVNVTDASVEHLIAVVESLMRPQAIEKGLQFRIHQLTDLPTMIQTDPVRARQCILNLINFSLSCTEKGHIYVNVALEEIQGKDCIKFEIEDTSNGIPEDKLKSIFDRFDNAELLANAKNSTGLGLAITKKIATILGGDVDVKSQEGVGSKFSLFIPAGVNVAGQPTFNKYDRMDISRRIDNETDNKSDAFDAKALVAEDTPTNQTLIRLILEKMGLDVTLVEDGGQAVKAVENEDFDLILMDIQMPNMNGYDATKKIRMMGFRKPIIAVTAHAMKGDRDKCINAGCDDYVAKPIDRDEIGKLIRKYLQMGQNETVQRVENANSHVKELTDMCTTSDEQVEMTINGITNGRACPIEWQSLIEICDDEDVIYQVVEMFLKDSPRCIGSLAEAIKDANPKHIRMYAHSLKGAALQIGAKRLADVAYELECAGRDKEFDNVPELFNQIQDEYGVLSMFLCRTDWMEKAKEQSTAV